MRKRRGRDREVESRLSREAARREGCTSSVQVLVSLHRKVLQMVPEGLVTGTLGGVLGGHEEE